jgi:hypothetical protein
MQNMAIHPHVHWTPVDANAGNVLWQLEYSWATTDYAFGAAAIIETVQAAGGVAWRHNRADFAFIQPPVPANISSMLVMRLFRDPTDPQDTYGSDAALLEFDFHIRENTRGSNTEFIK